MENLKQLIYGHYNPLINNDPSIVSQRPQFQLLYEEVDYMIQTLFDNEEHDLHELENATNLKKRFKDSADEAEDIVDMFISSAILKDKVRFPDLRHSKALDLSLSLKPSAREHEEVIDCSLNLKAVMKELKSIKDAMRPKKRKSCNESLINNNPIQQLVMKDMMQSASPQAAGTSTSTNPARQNPSATVHEDVIVGFDEEALSIKERLAADRKQLDIISIVGMGGLGKTTLATKVYNDPYVLYHFPVRGWITVSKTYAKRDLLIGLLKSIGKSDCEAASERLLCEMLYKSLKRLRYLIVVDDIWSATAWEDLRLLFPDDNTGSRVMLTTRLAEVALHARPGNFTLNIRYLTPEESWELLRGKVFRGDDCPEILIEIGKHIAEKCQGLPLALVVIAGLLEKGEKSKDLWEKVAKSVGSYIANDPEGCLDTLALSYDHLPRHLKNCFLYVGGFPEDYEIEARRLIRLWMAEGFIKEASQKSLEEQGEDFLIDLVNRNLLIVVKRRFGGGIKSCRLHDLLRELCLKKATEGNFFKKIGLPDHMCVHPHMKKFYLRSHRNLQMHTSSNDKQYRLVTNHEVLCELSSHHLPTRIRSANIHRFPGRVSRIRWVASFMLLRVLELQDFSEANLTDIQYLVHLRYLAFCFREPSLPISIHNLCGLQTLIVRNCTTIMHHNMAMVNLRHLCSDDGIIFRPGVPVLSNLQTISGLRLDDGAEILLQSFPNIKKLGCYVSTTLKDLAILNFATLTHLETLKITYAIPVMTTFPESLKQLTLVMCGLPWTFMSNIQRLPKLEVLKLLDSSFEGSHWDIGEEQFPQLKVLILQLLDIELWEASSVNFPQLKKLVVRNCINLRKIPREIGYIFTLKNIEIHVWTSYWNPDNEIQDEGEAAWRRLGEPVMKIQDEEKAALRLLWESLFDTEESGLRDLPTSARLIQEEQHARGNYELNIKLVTFQGTFSI